MSHDGLQEKIQAVIDQHIAEEGGGWANGWFFIADFIDNEGEPSWRYATATDQRAMTSLGLLRWATGLCEYEMHRYFDDMAD